LKALRFENSLLAQIRALPKSDRERIGQAIRLAQEAFGQPHLHLGLGIRKLSKTHFELRAGLDRRLVFRNNPEELHFVFIGNHDEVKKFIKNE
jgi:hypothetical protein